MSEFERQLLARLVRVETRLCKLMEYEGMEQEEITGQQSYVPAPRREEEFT